MKKISLIALAAAASIASTSAIAADLGGNCCADLEERIAELEATAARKGNRKVKLTVSGWVNEAVLFWDDGVESNMYQVTNMVAQTRFRFVGDAKIDDRWSAGYLLEIGVNGARSDAVDENEDDPTGGNAVSIRHSAWWLNNKQLGKVWVGQTSSATDAITEINLANVGHFEGQNAAAMIGGFQARTAAGGIGPRLNTFMGGANAQGTAGTDPGQIGEGNRVNVVKYESPAIQGFTFSTAYGEDDTWDVALRYAGEFNGVKMAFGIGYQRWTDGNNDERNCLAGVGADNVSSTQDRDCSQLGMSGAIMHVPTGLFVHGVYGIRWDDNALAAQDDTSTQWLIMAGIEQKFLPLGKTTFFGVYQQWDVGATRAGLAAGFNSLEMTSWGLGINQQIDAAAMDLYLHYRHYSPEATSANTVQTEFKDFDHVTAGGIIRF
jgi:hypothetical protein